MNNSSDFNMQLCKERHDRIDERLHSLETKFSTIILLLFANLAGLIGVMATIWIQS